MSKLDRNKRNADIDRSLSELFEPKLAAAACNLPPHVVYRRMRELDLEKVWVTRAEKETIRQQRNKST